MGKRGKKDKNPYSGKGKATPSKQYCHKGHKFVAASS